MTHTARWRVWLAGAAIGHTEEIAQAQFILKSKCLS